MPRWFRRTLIVVATLLMASCSLGPCPARGDDAVWTPAAPRIASGCESCPIGRACSEARPQGACQAGNCESNGSGCPVCCPSLFPGPGDEYLCDGGDSGPSVGVLRDDSVVGLEQEDTVAHYTTRDGRVVVTPSSRVCVYAPRFASVRRVIQPAGATQRTFVDAVGDLFGPAEADRTQPVTTTLQNTAIKERAGNLPPSLYRMRNQLGEAVRLRKPVDTLGLVPLYANLQLMHAGVVVMSEGPRVAELSLAAITWTGDQEVKVAIAGQGAQAVFTPTHPGLLYRVDELDSPRLRLVKCASTDAAHPGDEVGFTLRLDNVGDAPVSDVVVVDNLTTRLEYVDGSAESSLEADFSTARNGAGSLVLRWELREPLAPGEGALLTFKTRVR
ncbi:MAG: hypothetical protein AAF805_09175 [Planctomycetota bacterium]